MSYYIGVDQSYSSTGIVVTNGDGIVVELCTISAKKETGDIFSRAWLIYTQLIAIVNNYKDPILCLEGLSFGGFGSATRDLAGLQFTIINNLRELHDITNITIVPPMTLKKYALGIGKGSKEDMVNAVPGDVLEQIKSNKYKKTNGLYDIVDAYWLSQYIRTNNKGLNK